MCGSKYANRESELKTLTGRDSEPHTTTLCAIYRTTPFKQPRNFFHVFSVIFGRRLSQRSTDGKPAGCVNNPAGWTSRERDRGDEHHARVVLHHYPTRLSRRLLMHLVAHANSVGAEEDLIRIGWPERRAPRANLYPYIHQLRQCIEPNP